MSANYKLTKQDRENGVALYRSGKSLSEVAKVYSVDHSTVWAWLKTRNIDRRLLTEASRIKYKTTTNDCAFDDITKPDVAYWIGFIAGDGAVYKNTLALCLHDKDSVHCEKFRDFVSSSQKLIKIPPNKVRVAINSQKIILRLFELGIGENKSLSVCPPEVLEDDRNFWRGIVDADGSLAIRSYNGCKKKATIDVCGSEPMMKGYLSFMQRNGVGLRANVTRMKTIYRVQFSCRNAEKAISILYKDATVHLNRKNAVAQDIVNGAFGIFLKGFVGSTCLSNQAAIVNEG